MKKYVIKKAIHGKGDPFGFFEASQHLYLFARSLKELRETIRCLTPCGYGIRSSRWFSKNIKCRNGELTMLNPLLKTTTYEIREIDFQPEVDREIEFTNREEKTIKLKIVKPETWK